MPANRRQFMAATATTGLSSSAALAQTAAPPRLPALRAPRLKPGDTVALINPSNAIYERAPYVTTIEALQALGFKVREAPHLRARYGHFAGTDAQRAGDVNAMFADPTVHGILAMTGGSGGGRILPLIDYGAIRRTPKFFGGFSDLTALINAINAKTGLVTFHCPMGNSEWNAFDAEQFRGAVMDAQALLLANPQDRTEGLVNKTNRTAVIRSGKARGPLVGGNLAVFSAMAGSGYWPRMEGAILCLEDVNEYIYRVDRMLSTLKLAGALDNLAGVVLGAFTKCEPGDGFGTLTLDEVFDDYFTGLNIPVFSGASFGHIRRKFTLPLGLDVEMDADAGTIRYLQAAVV